LLQFVYQISADVDVLKFIIFSSFSSFPGYSKFSVFKMLALEMASNENLCDDYVNLLHQRKNLELSCREKMRETDDEKIKRFDEEKLQAKMKIRYVLRDYIQELNEKLELLTIIVQDISSELIEKQIEYSNIENVLKIQQKALAAVESENEEIEININTEVSKIRENFISKWSELDRARQNYTEHQQKLEKFCDKQNELEVELIKKKLEHHKILCCIKSIRNSCSKTGNVTKKMYEELLQKQEKYLRKCKDVSRSVECYRQKICLLQQEMDIVRKTAIIKLNVTKLHDDWKTETLEICKEKLQSQRDVFSKSFDERDEIIRNFQKKIKLMETDVNESTKTIENLQNLLAKVAFQESSCKKVIKPSTKDQPKTLSKKLKQSDNFVIARDYLGSTFIKLE
jgi:hypothetical protein